MGQGKGSGRRDPGTASATRRIPHARPVPAPRGGAGRHRSPGASHLPVGSGARASALPGGGGVAAAQGAGPGLDWAPSPQRGPLGPRPPPAGRALSLTAPDAQLQLGLVQVLHIVPQEAVQQVRDHRLQHHGGAGRREEEPEPRGAAEGGAARGE